jgi:hypothetical protein
MIRKQHSTGLYKELARRVNTEGKLNGIGHGKLIGGLNGSGKGIYLAKFGNYQ